MIIHIQMLKCQLSLLGFCTCFFFVLKLFFFINRMYLTRHRHFSTIEDYCENSYRITIDAAAARLSFSYRRGDPIRKGYIQCIPIQGMNGQKYWFKTGTMNEIEHEYQTMIQLKEKQFKYNVSDFTFQIDTCGRPWLITKDDGTSIETLCNDSLLSGNELDNIVKLVKDELDRVGYVHPDFASRNILYHLETKKITLIDFEQL